MRCHCFERGCIQDVFFRVGKLVFVLRWCLWSAGRAQHKFVGAQAIAVTLAHPVLLDYTIPWVIVTAYSPVEITKNVCLKLTIWKTGSTTSVCIGCSNNNTAANSRLSAWGFNCMYKRHCHYNKHIYWMRGTLGQYCYWTGCRVVVFFSHLCELSTIQQNLAAASFSNFICLFSNSRRSSDPTIQWPLQMTLTSDLDLAYFCLFNLFSLTAGLNLSKFLHRLA